MPVVSTPEQNLAPLVVEPLLNTSQMALASGWNLLAVPVGVTNTAPAAVFASLTGSYNLAYTYNGCNAGTPWQKYNPTGPTFADRLPPSTGHKGCGCAPLAVQP